MRWRFFSRVAVVCGGRGRGRRGSSGRLRGARAGTSGWFVVCAGSMLQAPRHRGHPIRMRKVLRDRGCPRGWRTAGHPARVRRQRCAPRAGDRSSGEGHDAGLVVLGVGLGEHPGAGGGVLGRDLDDGLPGQPPGREVQVPRSECDQFTPAEAGVDRGLHSQPMLRRESENGCSRSRVALAGATKSGSASGRLSASSTPSWVSSS